MKWLRLVVVGGLLGLGVSTFIKLLHTVPQNCTALYRHDATVSIGINSLSTEIAKTDAEREQGLSGRECIGSDQAMLFVFNKPGSYPFWMKDMRFPIDIVWVDSSHKVTTVKSNVSPSTYPQKFVNKKPSTYVLELQAGRAQKLNITEGTDIKFNL